MDFTFTVPLRPMPAPRPRLGKGRTFMPAKYTRWMADFGMAIPYPVKQAWNGPTEVFITFSTQAPKKSKSTFKWPVGDIDNLCKGVLDAMTYAGVWLDDRQVVSLHAKKQYAAADSIEVQVIFR